MTQSQRTRPSRSFAAAAGGAFVAGALIAAPVLAQQGGDQGSLASLLSWALSTPENRVTVGAVEGALSSVATVRDIRIADRTGVWLTVETARLDWSRLALVTSRRLEINALEIGRMSIARRPEADEASSASAAEAPQLPALPVKIIVKSFKLAELALGEPVIGTAARLTAAGSAVLGTPSEGLSLNLEARRLDAAGRFAATLAYAPQSGQLDANLSLDEPSGGLLSRAGGLAGEPPIRLLLDGRGPIDRWAAKLDFQSGPDVGAQGSATINREGQGRRVGLALAARLAPLLPAPIQPVFLGDTRLDGDVLVGDDLALAIRRFDLASRAGRLSLTGTLDAQQTANLKVSLAAIPTDGSVTRAGDVTIGRLALDAQVTGPLTAARLAATIDAADVTAPGGRLGSLQGRLAIAPQTGSDERSLDFALQGSDVRPSDAALARALGNRLSAVAQGQVTSDFVLVTPRATLATPTMQATWSGRYGSRVVRGRLDAGIPDIAALSDLAGRPLRGKADLGIDIDGDPGRYSVRAAVNGAIDRFSAGIPALDRALGGRVQLTGAVERRPGGVAFDGIRLAGGSALLTLDGPATTGAAALVARLTVDDLRKADPKLSGNLAVNATLDGSLMQPDVKAEAVVRGWAGAATPPRVALAGRLGERIDVTADLTAIPLSLSALVAPELGLTGTLEGRLSASGDPAAPEGSYRITATRIMARAMTQAGLQPADLKAEGRLGGGRVTTAATLALPRVGTLQASGSAPLSADGALDLAVRGPVDLAVVNAFVGGARRVTGKAAIDLSVSGPASKPRLGGAVTLSGATFTDPTVGVRLEGIAGRIVAQGDTIVIERLSAATRNGGTLRLSGRVGVDPAAGFPGDIRIEGTKAELVSSDVVQASANLALTVSGPLARAPKVAGRIDLISTDIAIPDRLPAQYQPLPDTRHIRPPPAVQRRLAAIRKDERQQGGAAPVVALDLTVSARNRIFVRGRGMQAELGGDVRITGTSKDPNVLGQFDLRRGEINLAGQRINLVRGRITFVGDLRPSLDFLAQTQAADVTAQIAVTGLASEPQFTISSQPALPQDEVISRLLFARATGGLTGLQALQLAQTIAQLSGVGGPDAFDKLRRALGADSFDVSAGASGGPAVGASRYLSRNVRVGVRAGATPRDTGVGVDVDVTRRIKLRGQVGADGSASAGAAVEWEY
jgi:autotransporter translocation and assembly factor TamB